MHDLRAIREGLEALRSGMERRGRIDSLGPTLDRLVELDRDRRLTIQALEERKAARNASSQEVARRKRAGEDATELVATGRALGEEIGRLDRELATMEGSIQSLLAELPNVTLPDVPLGGEEANTVVRSWGTPRAEAVVPHWELGEKLGILDLARGARISGSGFVVLRGNGPRLVRALMNFMIDLHLREHDYEEAWVPFVVNRASMFGTGQLPKFEDDMYGVDGGGMFLVPTAEVPITNLLRDEILDAGQLPKGITGYSPCFRREAGAAGKDTRGLIRVHQFDKVELVRFTTPEQSAEQHELLTRQAERVLQLLELPYRVLLLAAGDTGFASAKTYDLEIWAPGVGKWLEVSSCSNFLDFQARRANIRYRPAPGEKPRFVHTLNGSGVAFPRTIIGLLEHHQQPDGSVRVPEALRPYLGTDVLR
ncbi:MAG TPA: serine--tRNA ligase [Gemmatimonadaceae bacterium]|nr:serine--tRNA ligase [Gemmatimonadaceae bacterium]